MIREGSSATQIAKILSEKKLIRSPLVFKLYLKQKGLANQMKAGRFVFFSDQTLPEIVQSLVEGKTAETVVTILEGWTLQQIAEHLENLGLTTKTDFLECVKTCRFDFDFLPPGYLEGYLYPDTYFVNPSFFKDEDFIRRLLETFEKRIEDDQEAIEKSGRTLEQLIIMASVIEREERAPAERPKVADILWRRFDHKIGLGADATILYALGRTKGGLTAEELKLDSPYNTRKYRDLPPTPISNPSLSSIRATLYPEANDYWYYLHDEKGQIHYAKTLEGHNQNKAKYL